MRNFSNSSSGISLIIYALFLILIIYDKRYAPFDSTPTIVSSYNSFDIQKGSMRSFEKSFEKKNENTTTRNAKLSNFYQSQRFKLLNSSTIINTIKEERRKLSVFEKIDESLINQKLIKHENS